MRYTELNILGLPIYEERFRRYPKGFILRKDSYNFNNQNEIESLEASYSDRAENLRFNFVYSQEDSSNNWRQRETYQNNILAGVTKRIIFYNK